MQFHHFGYASGDPRIQPVEGATPHRPDEVPEALDVLIVGAGPAGMITAAQLSQFPDLATRIIESRPGRLELAHADGIHARSVETFQAFGFAERLAAEAFHITEISFWKPDPADPSRVIRAARTVDDPMGLSEFPHLTISETRVLDYLAEFMMNAPTRMRPNYGIEFKSFEITNDPNYPVKVTVVRTSGEHQGQQSEIWTKYLVGADGAHSRVRTLIGCEFTGDQANHAWGVMDALAVTDFPDIRLLSTVHSATNGNILLIPREGGYLFRMYVDLGEVPPDGDSNVRNTPVKEIIAKANAILHPYTIEVKDVVWYSVYEVGHRLSNRFDNVDASETGTLDPTVFILGDACHTHSAKGGQGMNVSMQDGFNLGWKLGHVLEGRSPRSLLCTYSAERQAIAKSLIDFSKKWSTMLAKKPDEFDDFSEVESFFAAAEEFRAGFMTEYPPSMIVGRPLHQALASGFPVGRRFASAKVARVCDTNVVHLGHEATADGRWRIYVFADDAPIGGPSAVTNLADWFVSSPESPLVVMPEGIDPNAWFDVRVIYQQPHEAVDMARVPKIFLPSVGPFELTNYENVYAALAEDDIFTRRAIDRQGAVVVVRPDQYVANVLPLTGTDELAGFFGPICRSGFPA